ncbi:MAG: hypothetical protein B6D38_05455 [Anaerolineae bacterium UTCFX1]|jgi:hypothetical protein|nr:MAG: hypothetical protein B6D38_05455 [Anaerolineae bacterium UTCFX1]
MDGNLDIAVQAAKYGWGNISEKMNPPRESSVKSMMTMSWTIGMKTRTWLKRVKQAYKILEKTDEWKRYLEETKEKYKRRPALQNQLARL